jgi:hypothetical protein
MSWSWLRDTVDSISGCLTASPAIDPARCRRSSGWVWRPRLDGRSRPGFPAILEHNVLFLCRKPFLSKALYSTPGRRLRRPHRYHLAAAFSLNTPGGMAALNAEVTRQAAMVAYIDDFKG